jgi:hypothetical protein
MVCAWKAKPPIDKMDHAPDCETNEVDSKIKCTAESVACFAFAFARDSLTSDGLLLAGGCGWYVPIHPSSHPCVSCWRTETVNGWPDAWLGRSDGGAASMIGAWPSSCDLMRCWRARDNLTVIRLHKHHNNLAANYTNYSLLLVFIVDKSMPASV